MYSIEHFFLASIYSPQSFFIYPSWLPFKFIFAFHGHVKGAYLGLAEVKWVKYGVPGV